MPQSAALSGPGGAQCSRGRAREERLEGHPVKSPMVDALYRAASPGAKSFVSRRRGAAGTRLHHRSDEAHERSSRDKTGVEAIRWKRAAGRVRPAARGDQIKLSPRSSAAAL
jgi:hypothetical protein